MSDAIILHHHDTSPFLGKVRILLAPRVGFHLAQA
jgi:hypothetical protein